MKLEDLLTRAPAQLELLPENIIAIGIGKSDNLTKLSNSIIAVIV
jgi:hypothetical protein